MPRYDYHCSACDETWEEQKSIDARDEPTLLECPACGERGGVERFLAAAPGFGDAYRLGQKKVPDSFKDLLKNMKKKHLHSTINTQ